MDGRSDDWMEFGAVHKRRKTKKKTPLGACSRSRFFRDFAREEPLFFLFFGTFVPLLVYTTKKGKGKMIRKGMREKPSERGRV